MNLKKKHLKNKQEKYSFSYLHLWYTIYVIYANIKLFEFNMKYPPFRHFLHILQLLLIVEFRP